jgi:hypothetical protein
MKIRYPIWFESLSAYAVQGIYEIMNFFLPIKIDCEICSDRMEVKDIHEHVMKHVKTERSRASVSK